MFSADQYQLVDFGMGRKLERFGPVLLDRPAPGLEAVQHNCSPAVWQQAAARYERTTAERGLWRAKFPLPGTWCISHAKSVLEVKPTEFGHLGVFPEQAVNWDWICQQVSGAPRPLKVLNLFAYTGGSTLAAAAAGAEVVHVDGPQNTVQWARQNAALSGLADEPIRWIVEDALKFVRRELKRDNRYDAVILDPPSYGHGPRGEVWKLEEELPMLLSLCGELTAGGGRFMLLTCHSPGFDQRAAKHHLADAIDDPDAGTMSTSELFLETSDGRRLPSGVVARWSRME